MARVTKRPADEEVVVAEPVEEEEVIVVDETAERERVADRDRLDRERLAERDRATRDDVHARERDEFGGMKFGSAFFGWLTALGMGVLLTAIVVSIGTAAGFGEEDAVVRVRDLGIVGAVIVAVVMFLAYLAGGYVAGRMARFSGAKQGFAVWLWALIAAIVVAVLGLALGARFDVLSNLDAFPRIPIAEEDLTAAGIITAVSLALITLVGAIFGGLAGMRYHRRVDRVGEVVE